jgi:hypothetical protein
MDKGIRLIVHNWANALNIKSKAKGIGRNRYLILYKTERTKPYNGALLRKSEKRLRREKFGTGRKADAKRIGSGIGTAVFYKDGEIVDGKAPEIGVENKGRAMLEKMGWSTGTALGALNNKGIVQPVSHVFKTTKAGLGGPGVLSS